MHDTCIGYSVDSQQVLRTLVVVACTGNDPILCLPRTERSLYLRLLVLDLLYLANASLLNPCSMFTYHDLGEGCFSWEILSGLLGIQALKGSSSRQNWDKRYTMRLMLLGLKFFRIYAGNFENVWLKYVCYPCVHVCDFVVRQLMQNQTSTGLRSVALVRTQMEASRRRHLAQAHRFLKVIFFNIIEHSTVL